MELRPATPADEAKIERLLTVLHDGQHAPFRLHQVRQGHRSFVATEGDAVLGFVLATFVSYGGSGYGMLEELVVDEAHRGQGIGRTLVDASRDWLTDQGVEVVFVSALDEAAERFYVRHGFARCSGPWLCWAPQQPSP
jgi:predicted N-acetyltransferase YhbS